MEIILNYFFNDKLKNEKIPISDEISRSIDRKYTETVAIG
jgi:hypothetical protein